MRLALDSGEPQHLESYFRAPGESRKHAWSVAIAPLKDRTGRLRGVCHIAQDMTEQYEARQRLILVNEAGTRIGTTLDITRTAQELADVAVPRLADYTSVDLLTFLHRGDEPSAGPPTGGLPTLCRARAAVCIDNARSYTRERTTAETLQRSLLPQTLPRKAAVEVASRYLPAGARAGVGGDWFDVIPLSGERIALVVGDVVGCGLQASATMGRLRTAVRTLADIDLPPDELLTHLDDVVVRLSAETCTTEDAEIAGEIGASCLYSVYDPVSRRCTLARAGHPPPIVVTSDGTAHTLDLPAGPPLGLGSLPFEASEIELPEGSLLALYTDGLIESRGSDIDEELDTLRNSG